MKISKRVGCVAIPVILALVFALYREAFDVAYRLSGPSRVVIIWPSDWGCDEFHEAYTVLHVRPANSFIRLFHKDESFIVPYPSGHYRDTTQFYAYYAQAVKWQQEDTVIVSGYFGDVVSVGEGGSYGGGGGMYACDPIPYFRVQNIYSKRGRLIKHFASGE